MTTFCPSLSRHRPRRSRRNSTPIEDPTRHWRTRKRNASRRPPRKTRSSSTSVEPMKSPKLPRCGRVSPFPTICRTHVIPQRCQKCFWLCIRTLRKLTDFQRPPTHWNCRTMPCLHGLEPSHRSAQLHKDWPEDKAREYLNRVRGGPREYTKKFSGRHIIEESLRREAWNWVNLRMCHAALLSAELQSGCELTKVRIELAEFDYQTEAALAEGYLSDDYTGSVGSQSFAKSMSVSSMPSNGRNTFPAGRYCYGHTLSTIPMCWQPTRLSTIPPRGFQHGRAPTSSATS